MAENNNPVIEPNTEAVHKKSAHKIEWQYFDEESNPIHLCKVIYKNKPLIQIYPYSYNSERGITKKRIQCIELRGWDEIKDVPTSIRSGERIGVTAGKKKLLMNYLYKQFIDFDKLVIDKNGKSRFAKKAITFSYNDYELALKAINKETRIYEIRRKTAITNNLSSITTKISERKTPLSKGALDYFLSAYNDDYSLSDNDIDSILSVLSVAPAGKVSVTENFIQTKDKINVAYLDDVINKYKSLLKVNNDNEKDWQIFFEKHGWILANLFPFHVVLRDREAYVGGKTIENKEGRVVDFLFQNGFRDNYALLEIKTHKKTIIKNRPYRNPDVYSIHEDMSGAISQCLDQKNTFMTDMGQMYKILDPKVVLVIGMKSKLNESQKNCFELVRSNQKNVEIVTFDELLDKINGLRDILRS